MKLIHDIHFKPGDPNYANYVDTPENRKLLYDIIREEELNRELEDLDSFGEISYNFAIINKTVNKK